MKKKIFIYLLLIIIPFLILSPYTFQYLEVGNDFELYYFVYKKYIFELLRLGHIPLWSPVEASGYSLIFNPLTQFFYIPSWIFYFYCFLIDDLNKHQFLIYTISAISIFNIGIFLFLKTLNISSRVAVTTIIITCLSLKVTELLRFPNAIHAFSWFPWVLYGINLANLDIYKKKSFLIIFFACLMLFTAGYPYYIFYGFILFFLYFCFLLIFHVKEKIFFNDRLRIVSNRKFFLNCLYPSILSVVISAPWLIKVSQLMSITSGRNKLDINFSFSGSGNIYDQIGSWIYPPYAVSEGWFYFGAISVFIIITILAHTFFIKKKYSEINYKLKYFFIFFLFLTIITYQFSNPVNSFIFKHIWNNLDFIANFRFWVRINIIFVPIIAVVLALSIQELINILERKNLIILKKLSNIIIFYILIILILQFYLIHFDDYQNLFWDRWQLKRILYAQEILPISLAFIVGLYKSYIYPIFFLLSFIIIYSLVRFEIFFKYIKKNKNIFLFLIVFLTFSELFFLTNIQWAIPHGFYDGGYKKLDLKPKYNNLNKNALLDIKNSFYESRVSTEKSGNNHYEGNTYYRNNKKFNINHISNWGSNAHVKIFKKYFNSDGSFRDNLSENTKKKVNYFFGMDKNVKKIFFSKNLKYNNIEDFIEDANNHENESNFSFDLIKYNGDILIIDVLAKNDGWVSFIDTWDHNWIVLVNSKQQPLSKLFDAYKSINIKSGSFRIQFIYKPFNLNFTSSAYPNS